MIQFRAAEHTFGQALDIEKAAVDRINSKILYVNLYFEESEKFCGRALQLAKTAGQITPLPVFDTTVSFFDDAVIYTTISKPSSFGEFLTALNRPEPQTHLLVVSGFLSDFIYWPDGQILTVRQIEENHHIDQVLYCEHEVKFMFSSQMRV